MPALAFFYLVCLFWHFSRRFPAPHLLILVVRGSIFYHVPSLSRSLLRLLVFAALHRQTAELSPRLPALYMFVLFLSLFFSRSRSRLRFRSRSRLRFRSRSRLRFRFRSRSCLRFRFRVRPAAGKNPPRGGFFFGTSEKTTKKKKKFFQKKSEPRSKPLDSIPDII